MFPDRAPERLFERLARPLTGRRRVAWLENQPKAPELSRWWDPPAREKQALPKRCCSQPAQATDWDRPPTAPASAIRALKAGSAAARPNSISTISNILAISS